MIEDDKEREDTDLLLRLGIVSTVPPGIDLSRRDLSRRAVENVLAFFARCTDRKEVLNADR
jgi:hypothetical protein